MRAASRLSGTLGELSVAARVLTPSQVTMGCAWLAVVDGADAGQAVADDAVVGAHYWLTIRCSLMTH